MYINLIGCVLNIIIYVLATMEFSEVIRLFGIIVIILLWIFLEIITIKKKLKGDNNG